MLSLFAWVALPKTKATIKVYSKLGGMYVGSIDSLCLKELGDAYSVLRYLQDRIATWLCHAKRPSRYLALFVGTKRLTKLCFPFVTRLDTEESMQVFDALGKTCRIDVLWDEDLTCAENRLASLGLEAEVSENWLSLFCRHAKKYPSLLPREVEAFTFHDTIRKVCAHNKAETLGCIHLFPHLEILSAGGCVDEVDFKRLARIKTLAHLEITTKCLNKDVGLMTSLKTLCVEAYVDGCIPTTIGLLSRLTNLSLCDNFSQAIPSEIGDLCALKRLKVSGTNLCGSIPNELCRLTNLETLEITCNPHLEGSLPEGFRNLVLLTKLSLHDTPVNTKGFMNGWQYRPLPSYLSFNPYWTRQI